MAEIIYNSPNGGTNPSWIPNINLENSTAGVPGFINISRHQCVGDSPEGLLRFKGGYDWSCTHYPYEQAVADAAGISITLDVSSPNLQKSLTGIDYVTKKEKIVTTVNGGMPLVKGLNGCDRTLGFRHPRTNQQDLKYLGIPSDDVNPLPSVYPGSRVDYWIHAIGSPMTDTPQSVKLGYIILRPNGSSKNPTSITQQGGMFYSQHSGVNTNCRRLGLRGIYGGVFEIGEEFKEGDVLILTIGSDGESGSVSTSGKGPYGIGSMKNSAGQRMGTCIGNSLSSGHCNCDGDPGSSCGKQSCHIFNCWCNGTCDELFNNSVITSYGLKAPSSGKVNGVYREHYSSWWHKNGHSHGGVGEGGCDRGVGGQPSYGAQNVNFNGLSVRIDITPKTRSRSDIGCLNTRDFDNSFGLYQQLWDHPESGSHIAKLVPYDYYEFPLRTSVNWYARECSLVVNEFNENVQNSIIYKSGCGSNLGDLPGDETFAGRAYDTKCVSYSMNISPKNNILTNTDKCCAPVISGPFLIEENKKGVRGERINDSPNKDESLQPDISNYYNLKYMLENRVVCECQGTCRNHKDDQDDPVVIITDDTSIKSYTCDPSTYSCVGTTIEPNQLTHFTKYTDCSNKCARPDVCTSGLCPCNEADGETRIYYLDNLDPCFFCCSGPLNGTQMFTVSPNMGDVGGGTAITITGQEFTGTTSDDPPITYTVDKIYLGTGDGEQTNIDWELVTSLNVISDKKLTCVTPPGTVGPKDIIMFTKNTVTGETLDQITKVDGFTYGVSQSLPAILSYSPTEGSITGGTTLTIVGTNLTSADTVKVGGVACTNLTKTSTSITAKTPAGSLGTKSVAAHFTSPDTTLTLTPVFTYTNNTSVIDRISPTSGTQFGGTAITLYGLTTSDFSNINDVKIGGVSVSFAVDPIFKYIIRFTIPLKDTGYTIGTTPIVITNTLGVSASVNFSYLATVPYIQTINTLSPYLQVRQGQTINITGSNFINIDRVYLSYDSGGTPQEAVCTFTVLSPTSMQIILPNIAGQDLRLTPPMTGVVALNVLNKALLSGRIEFTCYANPYITSFSPSNMGQGETQSATIRGFNFTSQGSPLPTAVLRNDTTGIEYSAYNISSFAFDTTISSTINTTGIPAGRYTVVVKDPAGETSLSGFSVAMGAPTITGVEVWASDGSGVPNGRLYNGNTSQYMDTYSPTTPYASPDVHYLKIIGNNLDTTDPLFEFHIRSQTQIAGNTECGTDFKTWAPPNTQIDKSYADPSGKFFFWKIETGRCIGSAKPTGGTFDVMDIKVISSGGSSQKLSAVKVVGYRPPFMSYIRNVGGGASSPTPVSGQVTSWGGGNERVITVLDNNNFAIQRIILEPNLVSGDSCKITSYQSGVELLPCSDLTARSVGTGCPGSRLGCFDYERTLPWSANYDPMYIHIYVPDFPSQTTMAKYWKDPLVYQFANINTSGKLLSRLSAGDTLLVSSVGSAW